jgi:hypothetical protein
MEKQKFEEELTRMSKPEIPELKHAGLLSEAIAGAKDRFVLSVWWLSIPLYVLAMLAMKAAFVPHAMVLRLLHELIAGQHWLFFFLFVVFPLVFIVVNVASLLRMHFLSGSPGMGHFVRIGWRNILMVMLAVVLVFIYL